MKISHNRHSLVCEAIQESIPYSRYNWIAMSPFRLLAMTILSIILTGCSSESCFDADDFGFAQAVISSRYKDDQVFKLQATNQVAPWVDSGFRVNGRPLLMVVKTWEYGIEENKATDLSAWCGWYGTREHSNTLSRFCERLKPCNFLDGKMCTKTKDARITNAPCLFKNGVGLYALIADRGEDPNLSYATQFSPKGISMHLGEPVKDFSLFDVGADGSLRPAGGANHLYNDQEKQQYADSKLYFKIVDKFYDDNSGQYKVVIKSGVTDNGTDPIGFLTKLVEDNLFGKDGLIKGIYQNLVKNPGYKLAVSACLTLYIIFTALSFLTGNLHITHTELITRVIKIGIISALLSSEYSWNFFNDYLFVWFIGGVKQIVQIIQEAGASGPGSASLLGLMIAPQTMAKLFSVLFLDWRGFIYILLFLIALYFIFMMTFQAAIIYLTALIAIGMIIIMGPVFLCFMLFQITRSLFENWLKQLISYAMQPLILFTGLAFISMLIREEIYNSLGFRVCKYDFPNLGPLSSIYGSNTENLDPAISKSIFYWWFPKPMKGEKFTQKQANIPVPYDHYLDDGKTFCEAYSTASECVEKRYVELPFLDPKKDKERIKSFFGGTFVHLDGLLLVFVAVYLLSKFNELAVAVSKFLSGTSGNLASAESSGVQAFNAIRGRVEKFLTTPYRQASEKVREKVGEKLGQAEEMYEGIMRERLGNEALDKDKANQAVQEEVKRTYGMDHRDLKEGAEEKYTEGIKATLKTIDPSLNDAELDQKARGLSGKNYKGLQDEFAKLTAGNADYKDPKKLNDLLQQNNVKGLASDAKFARDYKRAYFDAHQDMSERGIGMLGKRSSLIRTFEEMDNRVDKYRQMKQAKRRNLGERLYGLYGNIRRGEVWHDFDYNDPRLRTHNEALKDAQEDLKRQELAQEINRATVSAGDDILKPEYKVRLEEEGRKEEADYYSDLARRKLKDDVYKELSKGEDPVLMGDKFMREKATDAQMQGMVDRADQIFEEMLENDRYLRREEHYEVACERAAEHIQDVYDILGKSAKGVEVDKLDDLIAEYNADKGETEKVDLDNFKKAREAFGYNQKVLDEIDQRKVEITEEFNHHIAEINQYRKDAGMQEYKGGARKVEPRKVRTIEDHLRK